MTKNFTLFFIAFIVFTHANAQQTLQKVFYHNFNKPELTSSSKQMLDEFIRQLKQLDIISISVRSYADKTGSVQYNKTLSKQRNFLVLQSLRKQLAKEINYTHNYFGEDNLLVSDKGKQDKNRRTEISVVYQIREIGKQQPDEQVTELAPFTEDVQEQKFDIDLNDSVSLIANGGTTIQFKPGTFLTRNRERAKGKATVLIKEYYQPTDILLSGMNSVSPDGLLQTGGMFTFFIVQNNDTLLAETQKPVQIKMPVINSRPQNMNVFTANHGDTSQWNDTRKQFTYLMSQWNWPSSNGVLRDFYIDKAIPFSRWATGRKWSESYHTASPVMWFGNKRSSESGIRPLAKFVHYTIIKKDSATLSVTLSETFRRRGYKRFFTRSYDTTFFVKYSPPQYETTVSAINYINCDRFINSPEVTDFYVKTKGFKGAQMLIYFTNLNAYMPVAYDKGMYHVKKVPPGESVYIIGVGNRNNEFYFGKKNYTIAKNATAEVAMEQVPYNDMKKMFGDIEYVKTK